jgi:hypothetical protein
MGLIGGLIGIGQSLIDRGTDKKNIQRQGAMNMKLSSYQYSKDLDMWNRMNVYNSPKEQMTRFQEAGLNPNLMYGQGTPGNSATMPKYQAPEINVSRTPFNSMQVMGAYQDTTMKQAQIDNVKAQRRNTDADTVIKLSEGKYADALNQARAGKTMEDWKQADINRIWSEMELKTVMVRGEDNKYYIKPEYLDSYVNAVTADKVHKGNQEYIQRSENIRKTQADVAAVQILNEIRRKEKEYLESGGKYFNPILQFLRMMTK